MDKIFQVPIELDNDQNIQEVYICPECFKTINLIFPKLNIKMDIINQDESKDFYYIHGFESICYCNNCDSYMFKCDKHMAEAIVAINQISGYETLYCCEGHFVCNNGISCKDLYPAYIIIKCKDISHVDKLNQIINDLINDLNFAVDITINSRRIRICMRMQPIYNMEEINKEKSKEMFENNRKVFLNDFIPKMIQKMRSTKV